MNRRTFLGLSCGILPLAALLSHCRRMPPEPVAAGQAVDGIADELIGMSDVGRAYLGEHANEAVADELLATLRVARDQPLSGEQLEAGLRSAIGSDYAEGRLFRHRGWMLSLTEARLGALHVRLRGDNAHRPPARDFEHAPEGQVVRVRDWGPRSTTVGKGFNEQTDGRSAMWFTNDGRPVGITVVLNGHSYQPEISANLFSIALPAEWRDALARDPGEHELWIYDGIRNLRQRVGVFRVDPPAAG